MTFERPENEEELAAAVARLREMAASATTDFEAKRVTARIRELIRTYKARNRIGVPASLIEQAKELDQNYRVRPHLEYLSERITKAVQDVEDGQNRMLAVSMPPRSGKTMLLSQYNPVWLLRRQPAWKIVSASYDGALSATWARSARQLIESKPSLGIQLAPDGGAGSHWDTVEGGGLYSVSVRGPLTGRGANVLLIDDPVKDFVEAHSPAARQTLWDWWRSVAFLRLEPPYLVIVVMCMTGDTPVLRPDGTTTELRDIRPGDEIATYENGQVTTSRVVNWASQGEDDVFTVRMASGRTVRANARHPFLTVENGVEQWRQLGSLKAGMRVRCLMAPTRGSSAQQTAATSQRSARGCACPTTGRPPERPGTDLLQPVPRRGGRLISNIGTGSLWRSTTGSSLSRTGAAESVGDFPRTLDHQRTGTASCAWTTTTTPDVSGDCCASTAISSSHTPTRQSSGRLSSTWTVTVDEIVSIEPAGREDVFDLQVEGTENFIANGLCVHNTRWHEDDFVGRLFSNEYEGDPSKWERISLPALAEEDDVLGRAEGEPLLSPIIDEDRNQALDRIMDVKRSVGTYTFSAMHQQRPAPAKGAIFDSGWWRFWTMNSANATADGRVVHLDPSSLTGGMWTDSWDANFESSDDSKGGWVVGQRWVRQAANRYLVAQRRGRWTFTQTLMQMGEWALNDDPRLSPCGHLVHERLVEKKANGAAIIDVLKEKISGIKPINPTASKEARARAITPECESGNVYLPYPGDPGNEWVSDLLSELRLFPHDTADDQVDALTQALSRLRSHGAGQVSVPGRMGQTWQRPRNVAAAALTDLGRPRGYGRGV